MNITLTDKAKKYLEKKNAKTVTIDLYVAGCCIEIGEPTVRPGEPIKNMKKFDIFEFGGYTFYLFKGADVKKKGLVINAKKFLGMESMNVSGLRLL
jgi:hypothetical protein